MNQRMQRQTQIPCPAGMYIQPQEPYFAVLPSNIKVVPESLADILDDCGGFDEAYMAMAADHFYRGDAGELEAYLQHQM